MTGPELSRKLTTLPRSPGVYLFKDHQGQVIYIGKAKSLRERVRSYFTARGDGRIQVRFIEEQVRDLEVILTRSEKEAFLLENNLIKKMKPRFNIRLRDDKTYLHLRISNKHPFPAIVPVRRPKKDGAEYFGPYSSARAIRTTLRMLRGIYPLRDCSDHELANRTRPCLKYQIKMCSAPCVGYISEEEYRQDLQGALTVLKGQTKELLGRLKQDMQRASANLEYERAAQIRDRIAFLQNSTETQSVEMDRFVDRDVFGWHRRGGRVEIVVLLFRGGKLLSANPFSLDVELPDDEALSMFLGQYYQGGRPIPNEIYLPVSAYGEQTLAEWLTERRGRMVQVKVPRGGEGRRMVEMAIRNAELSATASKAEQDLQQRILDEVARRLQLEAPPQSIECVDVSHTSGQDSVASLVRFDDAEPNKDGYRRFKINQANPGDDYGAMREVIRRRFDPKYDPEQFPDLLIVDGGRGQVTSALKSLAEVGLEEQPVVGIVKPGRRGRGLQLRGGEEERIILADSSTPVILPPESEACYLLQRIRDEAHRFAISYHRRLRTKRRTTSVLEDVDGLGAAKARQLLQHFGGLRELKAASRDQLVQAPGIGATLAERIYRQLHRIPNSA